MVVGLTPLGAEHSRMKMVAPGVSTLLAGTTTSIGWLLSKVPGVNGVWAWAALVMVFPDAPGPVPAYALVANTNTVAIHAMTVIETATILPARPTTMGAAPRTADRGRRLVAVSRRRVVISSCCAMAQKPSQSKWTPD